MRLTEQFKDRLKKLAGLTDQDSKSQERRPKPQRPSPPKPGGDVSCTDPNWVNMSMGDQIGGPNYNALKYNYCDRCGYNWSGIDMGVDQGGLEVPVYIGMDVNDQLPGEISWMLGPPMAPFADNAGDDWSLGNFCSCCEDTGGGCTDPTADNYNPEATEDDGSCLIEMFMCINCEVVSIGMVPLYEDAMDWSSFNPDAFGGSGAYSLGYLYYNSTIENDYFSLNGEEVYTGNYETCGLASTFAIASYPQEIYGSCPNNPYAD